MSGIYKRIFCFLVLMLRCRCALATTSVCLEDITRIDGVRENSLVGYGIVMGLSGTGDSRRSKATLQSVSNALLKFGVFVDVDDLSSRNVAAAMVTATLPPFSEVGDKLDINVSSIGDARSLVGGNLLLTPLRAVNGEVIALSQGPISVGGYTVDANGNKFQKNHTTAGIVPGGAIVERATEEQMLGGDGTIALILNEPSFQTAARIVDAINSKLTGVVASAPHAGKVKLSISKPTLSPVELISKVHELRVKPASVSRIVINERTGTVVAGGNAKVDNVTITHGELKIQIRTRYEVSQPNSVVVNSGWTGQVSNDGNDNVRTAVVPQTDITVKERVGGLVDLESGTSVADLIAALNQLNLPTRDIITILQAINRSGALHAELVIQ